MEDNKLKFMSCYLIGPIDRAPDLGVSWRIDMSNFLESMGIKVLDPMNKPVQDGSEVDNREYRAKLKDQGRYDEFNKIMKRVRAVDLRFVDKADFFIVNYDTDISMCGTFEEIFLANRSRKPIIIMCPQGKKNIHDWMFGTLPHELFFDNWNQVKEYITNINNGSITDTVRDRWLFFIR